MTFVTDPNNDFIKVLTVTNESERMVRLVAKGNYWLTLEVFRCERGRYEWSQDSVHIDKEELLAMADAIRALPTEKEDE
jgi:hypothetical protein